MMVLCYPCVLNSCVFCYVVWNLPLEFEPLLFLVMTCETMPLICFVAMWVL
jgi:hypothetical protein